MSGRKLRIVIADDHEVILRGYQASIGDCFQDIDVEVECIQIKDQPREKLADELSEKRADMYMVDYNIKKGREYNGVDVILDLRRRGFDNSILLTVFSPDEIFYATSRISQDPEEAASSLNIINETIERIKDSESAGIACAYKDDPVEKTCEVIRSRAIKPIGVGIIGMGKFGTRLTEELLKKDFIYSIKIFSERANVRDVVNYLEHPPSSKRLKIANSIEDLIQGVDVFVNTSSALRIGEYENLHEFPDRNELFVFEREKQGSHFDALIKANYNGFIMNYTNPIGPILELGRRKGIPEYKLTSSFESDVQRIRRGLLSEREYSERERELLELLLKSGVVSGVHGDPKIVVPRNLRREFEGTQIIRDVETFAREIARKAIESSRRMGVNYSSPLRDIVKMFEDIARFRRNTQAYCFMQLEKGNEIGQGYLALPAVINYRDVGVAPDEKAIEDLGGRDYLFFSSEGPRLFDVLKEQQIWVDCA